MTKPVEDESDGLETPDDESPNSSEVSSAGRALPVDEAVLQAWIYQIVDQDEAALAALYDALVGRVYGLAMRITGLAQVAEEVTEDTFWQVWRQAPRFDASRGSALAWIVTIARSRALDARRAMGPEAVTDDLDLILNAIVDPVDLSDAASAAQDNDRLQGALAMLDELPRKLVVLAFFRGLTHDEIAEAVNLPLGTVKSTIRRALLRLRQVLNAEDVNLLIP